MEDNILNRMYNKDGERLSLEEIDLMYDGDETVVVTVGQLLDLKKLKSIDDYIAEAHDNAVEHGWWEEPKSFGELIALVHSEASEAFEEYRNGKGVNETYYSEGDKPEGIPSELADVVIRIFDTCGFYGIDLEKIINEKMKFNKSRPYKHGGKKL